jgi:hypothetical protein
LIMVLFMRYRNFYLIKPLSEMFTTRRKHSRIRRRTPMRNDNG